MTLLKYVLNMRDKMFYMREQFKHLLCSRHKRGYGVHSPFAYHLITQVIHDRKNRYAYPPEAEQFPEMRRRERKMYRLLRRLCLHLNDHWKEAGLCPGFHTACCSEEEAKRATCYATRVFEHKKVADTPGVRRAAFIFSGTNDLFSPVSTADSDTLMALSEEKCLLMMDIHRPCTHNYTMWHLLNRQATVSIDMIWYGILIFDKRAQSGHYFLTI